jgi:GMP synthase-like glutamine amidotransferase
MILFIKHIGIEGPETLGTFFEEQGFRTKTVELQDGDSLPGNTDGLDAVISLGGPMNVYEEKKYPFLRDENIFLKEVIAEKVPFIGICLGSQLLAKAGDAKVKKSPEKEIGFFSVQLTENGKTDPLLEGVKEEIDVFQWHEDMSELPLEATLLASSGNCPHQAFRIGPVAYGLQFHVEITQSAIGEWSDAYWDMKDSLRVKQKYLMIDDYQRKEKTFCATADKVYNNFMNIIRGQR